MPDYVDRLKTFMEQEEKLKAGTLINSSSQLKGWFDSKSEVEQKAIIDFITILSFCVAGPPKTNTR